MSPKQDSRKLQTTTSQLLALTPLPPSNTCFRHMGTLVGLDLDQTVKTQVWWRLWKSEWLSSNNVSVTCLSYLEPWHFLSFLCLTCMDLADC